MILIMDYLIFYSDRGLHGKLKSPHHLKTEPYNEASLEHLQSEHVGYSSPFCTHSLFKYDLYQERNVRSQCFFQLTKSSVTTGAGAPEQSDTSQSSLIRDDSFLMA